MVAAPIILAYFTAWSIYGRSFFVSDIPGDKITHINYAFANIGSDGRIALGDPWADTDKAFDGDTWDQPLRGNFNQLIKLKQKYPQLRTLISVGGWVCSFLIIFMSTTDRSFSYRHGQANIQILLSAIKVARSLLLPVWILFKNTVLMVLISTG